jgi:hypothetical protein
MKASSRLRALAASATVLVVLAAAATARAETFDLVKFTPPPGQRSAQSDAVGFTDATPTTFAVYGVYKSAPGSGEPARDFADEWGQLVGSRLRVTSELKTETIEWPGGWKLTTGAAKVWGEQQRNFVALLNVFTGYGVKVSVLVNYNDDLYLPKIDAFLANLRLQPPAAPVASAPPPQGPQAQGGSTPPSLTAHEWYRSAANYAHWGTNFTGLEIARIGSQGSSRWGYRFLSDGTYTFFNEFWSMNKSNDVWIVEESGTYRQSADTIEVTPRQVRRVLRDREGRQQGEAQPLAPEPATYRYAFQYLSGMQRWYLVLMPTTGRDTNRDGTRSTLPDFGSAYRYGPRPYCEQRPRPADCKG